MYYLFNILLYSGTKGATACKACPTKTGTGGKTGMTLSSACKTGKFNAEDDEAQASVDTASSSSSSVDTGALAAGIAAASAFVALTAYVVVKKIKQRSQAPQFNTNDKV